MTLSIEHIGIAVSQPLEIAKWYERVLGFEAVFKDGTDKKGVVFLRDSAGKCVLEIMTAPGLEPLCSRQNDPTQLHIAFLSSDPDADTAALVKAGATIVSPATITPAEDTLVLLKDPWGNTLQLVKRAPGRVFGPK